MTVVLTSENPATQKITGITTSATQGAFLRIDATGFAGADSFSLSVNILVNEPGTAPAQKVVWENTDSANLTMALVYETDGATYWRFSWSVGDAQPLVTGPNIGFNPNGMVVAVALSYQKLGSAAVSKCRVATYTRGMAATGLASALVGTMAMAGVPIRWGIGRNQATVSSIPTSNMRGPFVLYMFRASLMAGSFLGDGSTFDGAASVDIKNLVFPSSEITDFAGCATAYPAAMTVAINHTSGGRCWNGSADIRPGKSTANVAVFDVNAGSFALYFNRVSGSTHTGTIFHVNPYALAGLSKLPPPTRLTVDSGITVPFSNVGPIGNARDELKHFKAASIGSAFKQQRVLFSSNSRGVTAGSPAEVMLSDGTFTGRTLFSSFPESGIMSIPGFYNGGVIGGVNVPPPTGLYNYGAAGAEVAELAEPLWGPDCNTTRPLCRDITGAVSVPTYTATTRLVGTTYSRVWGNSRYATTVSGGGARFQGNGAPRSVNVGYSYRVLVRPESSLPVTEGLEVGFFVLNNPLASPISFRKEAAASAQNGADTIGGVHSNTFSELDLGNVSNFTVVSHTAPTFSSDTTVTSNGYIVVDNTSGAITANHVGQWLEMTTSVGARKDIGCIAAVDSSVPSACKVYYEGGLQNTPIAGDIAYVMTSPRARFTQALVNFAANEASGWRGIDIKCAPGSTGLGIAILGMFFRNTSRNGVIVGPLARSGCGYLYQNARYFHSKAPSGAITTSPFEEMLANIDPDLMIITTADQGDNTSFADNARDSVKSFCNRFINSPTAPEVVLYSTGAEFNNEVGGDKSEDGKVSYHMAYRQAAQDLNIPHLSCYYDLYYGTGCMNAHFTGEVTESRTHPSTGRDVFRILEQTDQIAGMARYRPSSPVMQTKVLRRRRSTGASLSPSARARGSPKPGFLN